MATPSLSLCRVCLSNISESKSIFSAILEATTESIKYSDILKQLSPEIFLDPEDGLPQQICLECQYKIASAFQIQQTFENSDRILRVKVCLAMEKPGCEQEDNDPVALEFIKLEVGEEELFDVQDDMEHKDPIEGLEPLRNEIELQGEQKIPYTCEICNDKRQFFNVYSLRRHKKLIHRDMSTDSLGNQKPDSLDDQTTSQSNTVKIDFPGTISTSRAESPDSLSNLKSESFDDQEISRYNTERTYIPETISNAQVQVDRKPGDENSLTCEICNDNRQFFNIQSLKRHKIHTHRKSTDQSDLESSEMISKVNVQDQDESIDRKSFTCDICNNQRQFYNNDSLKRHKKLMHCNKNRRYTGDSSLTCEICNDKRQFSNIHSLRRHKRLIHRDMSADGQINPKSESFEDQTTFSSNTDLMDLPETISDTKAHSDRKSGEDNSLTCDICNKQRKFSNIQNLRRHKMILHNVNYSEEIRERRLDTMLAKKKFQRKNVEAVNKFECNICNDKRQFFNIHSLRRHKRLIHGDMITDGQSNQKSESYDDQPTSLSNTELIDLPELISTNKTYDDCKSGEDNSFTCEICNDQRKFFNIHSLRRHKMILHNVNYSEILRKRRLEGKLQLPQKKLRKKVKVVRKKSFACSICNERSFLYKNSLERHIKLHNSTEISENTCFICLRKFSNKFRLDLHAPYHYKSIDDITPDQKEKYEILECYCCEMFFFDKKTRFMHVLKKHNKQWSCKYCETKFATPHELSSHIINHNVAIRDPQKIEEYKLRKSGVKIEGDDEKLNLLIKGKPRIYRNKVTKRNIKDKIRYPCEICKISFSTKQSLIRHTKTCHDNAGDNIQPRPKLTCDQCHRSFISKERLLQHSARHINSIDDLSAEQAASCKIFECYSCDMFFFDTSSRFVHLQRHHSPQISCKYCDESFEIISSLRSHIKIHNKLINKPQSVEEYKRQKADEVKRGIIIKCDVTTYSCDTCKIGFSSPHRLYNHNREVHLDNHLSDERQFVCKLCESRFKSEYFLTHHQNTMHSEPITLEEAESNPLVACKICLKRFVSEKACKLHHEKHKPQTFTVLKFESTSNYQCLACGLMFTNPNTRRKHALTHEAGDFKCTTCSEKFTWVAELHTHIGRNHRQYKTQYKCNICSKIVSNRSEFKSHMIRHQPKGEKLFPCKICEMKFRRPRQVVAHIKSVHENKPHPLCPECGKMVKENLNIHISREHRSEHLHQCPKCPRKYKTKSNLFQHERSHDRLKSEKRFHCDECGAAFRYESYVTIHKQRAHQKLDRPFKCEQCPKTFFSKYNLGIHFRIHTKEKPFECVHCDRAFSQKGDLTKHLRLQHIGDNVYKCTICEAGFRFLRDLKLHNEEHPPSADNLDASNDKDVGDIIEDNGN